MRALLFAVAIVLAPSVAAGTPSFVVAVGYSPHAPSVRVQLRADFVAVPITIQHDAKDPLKRFDQIENALRAISDRVKQQGDLSVRFGVVSLSPREPGKGYSSYDASGGSAAQLHVLGALKAEATVFTLAKRIHQVVTAVPVADGTRVHLGNTALGLEDAERFRPQLLGLIAKSAADTRRLLGASGPIDLEGLESPVAVMQVNESEVVVFINYRAKIQMKPAG
jgi:hypothetical protein